MKTPLKTDLYKAFLAYVPEELEELFDKAATKQEKDFYAELCDMMIRRGREKELRPRDGKASVLTFFGGVDGAGKSSFFRTDYIKRIDLGRHIDVDDIAKSIGDWSESAVQYAAAQEAIRLSNQCIRDGVSFNRESTMTGYTIFNLARLAKKKGYYVVLYYFGLDGADTAIERVLRRVSEGGHYVDENTVKLRYGRSLQQVGDHLALFDRIYFFDNTFQLTRIAECEEGRLVWERGESRPGWLNRILECS